MLEKLNTVPESFFTPGGKKLSLLGYLFLLVLCVGFFTPGLVTMPPTDRDESLFAQASKQMVETANYTDIRVQVTPRYKKPIGIYWLQSTSARFLSPAHLNEIWAYRLPSFLGATIAVLMTAELGALLFGATAGLLAAVMLAGCVLLNVEARLATTDAALLASIVVAMYGLARAYLRQAEGWGVPLLFWVAVAVGVLLKGPLILLPLAGVLLWVRVAEKNLVWFRALKPWRGMLFALLLVAPWFVAITMQSHGAFLQQSAGNDLLAKIWQGQNRGKMPPGFHLGLFPVLFFPFSLFALFAAPDAWKNKCEPAVRFCLGWIVPLWIVMECSMTKLPHYVMPAYPAIAMLTAKFLLDGFPTVANTTRRLPVALIIGLWFMIGMGGAFAFSVAPAFIDGNWMWVEIAAGFVLIVAQGAAMLLLPKQKTGSVTVLTLASLLFMSATFGVLLPGLQHIWLSREIVEAVEAVKLCPGIEIVSAGYHEPSLVFLGGTKTVLAANGTDAADALKRNTCRIAVIDNRRYKEEFLDAFKDAAAQPHDVGTIGGLNSGHGAEAALTLYVLPQAGQHE